MPCFSCRQGNPHRFRIPHLTDNNDIRSLPHRGPKRGRKIRSVDADLNLFDDALVLRVLVLDGIFNRDDVFRFPAVDFVDKCRERRRLARTGGSSDKHQTIGNFRQAKDVGRKVKFGKPRRTGRQSSKRCCRTTAFPVQVDTKTPEAFDPQRTVRAARFSILFRRVIRQRG